MTTVLPDTLLPHGQYGTKAASECLGISERTLLRWADKGLIKKRTRKANGRAVFRGDELIALWHSTKKA